MHSSTRRATASPSIIGLQCVQRASAAINNILLIEQHWLLIYPSVHVSKHKYEPNYCVIRNLYQNIMCTYTDFCFFDRWSIHLHMICNDILLDRHKKPLQPLPSYSIWIQSSSIQWRHTTQRCTNHSMNLSLIIKVKKKIVTEPRK